MDQNSGLKAPKKLACLLVKKCDNNGLELGNIKLITLYITLEDLFLKFIRNLVTIYFSSVVSNFNFISPPFSIL